ncbi:molybdopterin-dependent oxidoreductase alpha subunit [Duganella sp. 1224]|uniref:FdhF/YdeP family oxidoreductase n=1 Tax=Duganella sp. 1224 TaxID=2587052 RepID=UPI0015C9D940|nr:FdhF/YdeP family oxidoreductase [Duganella sp. 1224]NYE60153.1 molybdopterin-dependent oxidoreductase alpha subunit [Duganella sp. 1224]
MKTGVPEPHSHTAGGWGSLKEVGSALLQEQAPLKSGQVLLKQNKPQGFACVSCAWAKPAHPRPFEFCESGAKATAWELTGKRCDPAFFARYTVRELLDWSDFALEEQGRLTTPLRWDAASDRYVPVDWDSAFAEIGRELRALAPPGVVFYSSGRASLETSYMYQLLARLYGNNNLPDSSNMCHESTSVALPKTIGVPIGTVTLEDFEQTDCLFFFGQNVGTNSPRMLHQLQEARRRGVPIITFNPLHEPGLMHFVNPQSPLEMLSPGDTTISTQYLQLRAGGDIAAILGLCKALLAADDAALAAGQPRVLDTAFIDQHTHGLAPFVDAVRAASWSGIERESGLTRAALEQAAATYAAAERVIGVFGMGLTQHRNGVENIQMLTNLLLLRGNIGKPGAGICPVRGHSNVQGQRTVGITEKPELAPLDQLQAQYQFEPPRAKGLNTVETCEGVLDGSVRAFIGLGGNFVRAVPDTDRIEAAWSRLRLTVQVSTKLNRSHLVHGEVSYILPCLGRIEIDRQASGEQALSVEDSTGCMHGSRGMMAPASALLRSEPAIVAGIAQATLAPNPLVPWQAWVDDYSLVRDAIAQTYPEIFHDFNQRMWTPGGFRRPVAAAERKWKTPSGKAEFIVPDGLLADPDQAAPEGQVLRLFTLRSDGQFNTTLYNEDDRFRGISGGRRVLLVHPADLRRLGLEAGQRVDAVGVADDGVARRVRNLRLVAYDVPAGCVGGYYPECNPLLPLAHHARESKVPAAKSIAIRLEAATPGPAAGG